MIGKKPACGWCYKKHPSTHALCSCCGKKKFVQARTPKGEPVCRLCHDRNIKSQKTYSVWFKKIFHWFKSRLRI
jgi:hypothetical protein